MRMEMTYGIKKKKQEDRGVMPVPSSLGRRRTVALETADGCRQEWM